jgi:hypothetical protein
MRSNVKIIILCILWLQLALHAQFAWSSDACSTQAIVAAADVTVSDGSEFAIESFFQSANAAAIKHIRDSEQIIAVEGPLSWNSIAGEAEPGTDFHKHFALGHQFHALMLHFDEIVTDVRASEQIAFRGEMRSGTSGDYPYGGVVHLIQDEDETHPAGLLFELPESGAIAVSFDDWRVVNGVVIPFHVQIDDSERIFDYRYSNVDLSAKSPLWFFAATGTPAIDQVQVYRLHRKLLAAHCLGDADLMAELSAAEILIAGRGNLLWSSDNETRDRFKSVFQRVDYTEYHDIVLPVIEVSQAADIGWIGVNVRAIGSDISTGTAFDDQWAWIMLVKKIDDVWVHAGNASNHTN